MIEYSETVAMCPACGGYGGVPLSTDPESARRCERCEGHGWIDLAKEQEHADRVRLIEAAPDLLIACKAALNDRMYKDWPGIADLLIAAIAKAEGR